MTLWFLMGRHYMSNGSGGYAVCRMISEKTGCCGNIVLERSRVLSQQRRERISSENDAGRQVARIERRRIMS